MVDQWVILELTSKAEREDPDLIRRSIVSSLKGLKDLDVFIPAVVTQQRGVRSVHYLVEGYAFIRHKYDAHVYSRLEGTRFVQSVLTKTIGAVAGRRSQKTLAFASNIQIDKMRRQMTAETDQGIGVDDLVYITSGPYRQLTARVIEDLPENDKVQVHIQLRSKDSIIDLPRSFLRLEEKAVRLPIFVQFDELKTWFNDSTRIYQIGAWGSSFQSLQEKLQRFETLDAWSKKVPDLTVSGKNVTSLVSWQQWKTIPSALTAINIRHTVFDELVQFQHRLNLIRDTMNQMERDLDGKSVYDNILIDGLNLAFRAKYAPGLGSLADEAGHPTGMILGFLRSLASLRKRFAKVKLIVCWDGSNKFRKKLFAGYKSSRPSGGYHPDDAYQLNWLQCNLSLFGVDQAFSKDEEADDIIASMVRGKLKDESNAILSTDRDLLQLITDKVHVIAPAQATVPETIYDRKVLRAHKKWQVYPEQLLAFRALVGDPSDDIPGVGTVPAKVLRGLLEAYGSIDHIYTSNLAGLTKLQYERIKAAEPQVRLNLKLMALRDISYSHIQGDPNPVEANKVLETVGISATVSKSFF